MSTFFLAECLPDAVIIELEVICVASLFTLQVHPDLSKQLLQDGYRLDEIPDDEDLDLIPPKAMGSTVCCCFSEGSSCSMQ